MFLNSINYFRAIAIICIVAGHCFYTVEASFDTFPAMVFGNLITGGAIFFVFISGFLFHHIGYQRYQFKTFMQGKLKKILLPYTLLSILPIFLRVLRQEPSLSAFDPIGTGVVNVYLIPALKYYLTGKFLLAYWYIPFVMVMFLLSPLHIAFIKLRTKQQLLITALLLIFSLLLHRPESNLGVLQSVMYFMPVYLFGMLCSQKKELIYAQFKNKECYLLVVVIALAILQAALGRFDSYHKAPWVYEGVDIMLLQKLSCCLLLIVWLHRFEALNTRYINTLSATSFAIYFTHGFMLLLADEYMEAAGVNIENPWLWYPLVTVGTILGCLLFAIGIKRLAPNHSRYLIGY